MDDDKMMESLFETISIPLFVFHANRGNIVLANRNRASKKIAVCEPGQTTGKIFKTIPQIVTDIDTCFSQKKTLKRELFFTQVDGRIKYFRLTFSLLSKNFLILHVHDISKFRRVESELRRNKERLELAIFATDAGLWDWNIDSDELLLSAEWCAILGYTQDEVEFNIGFWENLIHPEDRDRVMKEFYDHLQGRTQRYQTEHRLKCKTGQWKWLLDTGKVVERDTNGKALRMIGTKTDITRRMEMEQEIKYLNSKLEKQVEKRTLKLKKKESSLIKSQQELRDKSLHLEEVNNALQVLMGKNDADKKELEQNILTNIEVQVLPFLDKIETSPLNDSQKACLGIIRSNLQEMAAPFSKKLISSLVKLTPAQVKIANFIRQGKSSKEMADLLFLSSKTIETQRRNIRKKLGITQKKINLRTYLESL